MHRAAQAVDPPANALVFGSVPFQTAWAGVGANYMGFAAFASLGLTSDQQTAEFDRAEALGIKYARTWFDPGWAYATYPAGSPNWSSADMTAFYTWVAAMQSRGINVILTMGWHFPANIAVPEPATTEVPTPSDETVWAAWVSESLNQLINVRGYANVTGCMFFTEPNSPAPTVPGGYTATEYYAHVVTLARDKIVTDDGGRTPIRPRIQLIGCQEVSFTDTDVWLQYMRANASGVLDVYTWHNYCQTPTFVPLGLSASGCPASTALSAVMAEKVADAAPDPFWVDEVNTLIGGDDDTTGYRATADAGWQLVNWIDAHMQGGAKASLTWMLQDQHWVGGGSLPSYSQQFGVALYTGLSLALKPSGFAFSLLANLVGGGGVTQLYRAGGGSSTLHGTGVYIPPGQPLVVDPSGEWTFYVINESATPVTKAVFLGLPASYGRTWYRYTYSGEIPPVASASSDYLLAWDQRFTGVTSTIPASTIPGRSFVVFSTIELAAGAVNLALTATATADSTGSGSASLVNDGNFSNVQGAVNGWKKANDSSHYVELEWSSAQTIGRLKLAFVGTTTGVVYATYTDTSSPTVLADYGVQYWNGSAFVAFSTPISVTGNTAPNKTHTFTPVSTTKIRLTVTSAAATGQVNQIGAYAA